MIVSIDDLSKIARQLESSLTRVETTRPAILGDETNIPLDDTTGWADLEHQVSKLQSILLSGSSDRFFELCDTHVADVVISMTAAHINRHVRQSTYIFIEKLMLAIFSKIYIKFGDVKMKYMSQTKSIYGKVYVALCSGLEDNWSEIRLVSCQATRAFLFTLSEADQSLYWPDLLPRLCLNRFYTAEGVQTFSLDTWSLVIKTRGKVLLNENMSNVVSHYTTMSQAKNHMVCEAACHAMAELVNKMDRVAVEPFLPQLLNAVYNCLNEPSWPVRDAAVVASGSFVRNYPRESKRLVEELIVIWSRQLQDPIWSVRENAAVAFGDALTTADESLRQQTFRFITTYLNDNFSKAKDELSIEEARKPKISSFLPLEVMHPTASVSQSKPSSSSFTSTSLSSQGKIDSKKSWRVGGGWGCCLDCVIERDRTLWERSAGCVVLLREMFRAAFDIEIKEQSKIITDTACSYLDKAWSLLSLEHFEDHEKLHTIVLQQLLMIYDKLRKLDLFSRTHNDEDSLVSMILITGDQIKILKRLKVVPGNVNSANVKKRSASSFMKRSFAVDSFLEQLTAASGSLYECLAASAISELN